MRRDQFRSPQHKLISFFQRSRDHWRARAQAYHDQLRELKVRVRDVEASRDHWRAKYFERSGAEPAERDGGASAGESPGAEAPLPGVKRRRIALARTGIH